MQVKKKNPEWFPKENPALKVGDTIEITDPKALILGGDAIAIGENGEEISAYELYGVVVRDEMQEFQRYLAMKKEEAVKANLEQKKAALEKQLADQQAAKAAETPATPVVAEPEKPEKEAKKKNA